MSKQKSYLLLGCALMVIGLSFLLYAVSHPELSFPWSNFITYAIYLIYGLFTGYVWALVWKHR